MTVYLDNPRDGLFILTMDRPAALNALNRAMMEAFAQCVRDLQQQGDALRVVVVRGAGDKAFSSGGDLHELSQHPDAESARDFITVMGDALLALERLPVPVIAGVNGYALGGGTEIALACDLRVVDEAVQFGLVQARMALTPGWGAGQRLMRLVGYSRAMQLLMEAHTLRAADLTRLGLVTHVMSAGEGAKLALLWATEIAVLPPQVVRGIKALLQAGLHQPYETALQTERDLFPPLWADTPHLEAVERFLARKK